MHIPFNRPYYAGKEIDYISEAMKCNHVSGNGLFTKKCERWLEDNVGCQKALLTHSCTAALEMAAILANIQDGDEVIMPSYTFVSTANAFVLRGGVPVFVDIRPDTLNIDESKIEAAITKKTKAIVPVHYAGVGCEMDTIMDIARRHNLIVIEDAAQAIQASYKGRFLGSIGHLAAMSFHETKNITSGEGGALLINDKALIERAEIIREKGTNRSNFHKGLVDKYTWQDVGSSYLPSEINAAFLFAQLEQCQNITDRRKKAWASYDALLATLENKGELRRPQVPVDCSHNGHLYYMLLSDLKARDRMIIFLMEKGVNVVFHYIPLHSSPAGKKYCRVSGKMQVTCDVSNRLIRLPLWADLEDSQVSQICQKIDLYFD